MKKIFNNIINFVKNIFSNVKCKNETEKENNEQSEALLLSIYIVVIDIMIVMGLITLFIIKIL